MIYIKKLWGTFAWCCIYVFAIIFAVKEEATILLVISILGLIVQLWLLYLKIVNIKLDKTIKRLKHKIDYAIKKQDAIEELAPRFMERYKKARSFDLLRESEMTLKERVDTGSFSNKTTKEIDSIIDEVDKRLKAKGLIK